MRFLHCDNSRSPLGTRAVLFTALLLILVELVPATTAQKPDPTAKAAASQTGTQSRLTEEEHRMADGSRKAILESGFSEPYFQEHFQLIRVINEPGDRRVVWRFSLAEYETDVNDALGYYTTGTGARVDIHSVKTVLGSTHDIRKVIPKKQAEQIMRKCIGKFRNAAVEFNALAAPGREGLYMTALAGGKKNAREAKEREEKERKAAAKQPKDNKAAEADEIESEEIQDGSPLLYGILNLETGECTQGRAIESPPRKIGVRF